MFLTATLVILKPQDALESLGLLFFNSDDQAQLSWDSGLIGLGRGLNTVLKAPPSDSVVPPGLRATALHYSAFQTCETMGFRWARERKTFWVKFYKALRSYTNI